MERLQAIVDEALEHGEDVLDQHGYLSTGEMIAVCMAIGTAEALTYMPSGYDGQIKDAWGRINVPHRQFILSNWGAPYQ